MVQRVGIEHGDAPEHASQPSGDKRGEEAGRRAQPGVADDVSMPLTPGRVNPFGERTVGKFVLRSRTPRDAE